jgi:hypothetical protein
MKTTNFLTRRLLDAARAKKDDKLMFLALDWAKAFDSVSPCGLFAALSRFGIPDQFISVIKAIYRDRIFTVKDAGSTRVL